MGRDPIRAYFNQHFEAVKDEVRLQTGRSHDDLAATLAHIDALSAERIHAVTERIGELEGQVERLAVVVEELRVVTAQLARTVAPLLERADGPPT